MVNNGCDRRTEGARLRYRCYRSLRDDAFIHMRLTLLVSFAVIGWVTCAGAQARIEPVGAGDPDPLHFLQTIAPLHRQQYYHVEARVQEETTAEYSQHLSKWFLIAIVAPGRRYRYDTRGMGFSWLQVSDGSTEWTYDREHNRYMQRPIDVNSPFEFRDQWSYEQGQLNDTHDVMKELAGMPQRLRNAAYLPDETITLNNQPIGCIVIEGEGKFRPGWSPDIRYEIKFWVDRQSRLIRQVRERMEGTLTSGGSHTHVRETTWIYTTMQLGSGTYDTGLFAFRPPGNASMVKHFPPVLSPDMRPRGPQLVGKPAPDVILHQPNGEFLSLRSFRGKPLLIEIWATWCAPCVESMPEMIKLYGQLAPKGMSMLAIDEDDEPQKVQRFLATHKPPWPNYHDDGEAARRLAGDGIPQFVLIDAAGIVRFVQSGFDEAELRAAIAKIGPEFSSLSARPNPIP